MSLAVEYVSFHELRQLVAAIAAARDPGDVTALWARFDAGEIDLPTLIARLRDLPPALH